MRTDVVVDRKMLWLEERRIKEAIILNMAIIVSMQHAWENKK